jgi:hypothetical protein
MSNETLPGESPETRAQPSGDDRIVIKLPYAISNMVFIQALPFWILTILGVLGFCGGFLTSAWGTSVVEALAISISSAVCALIGGMFLFVLRLALWRRALEGNSTAITVVFVFHLVGIILGPLFLFPMAAFVFLPNVMQSSIWIWMVLVPLVICGISWLLALMNLFEREIWSYAWLDGCCPKCRQWRFGLIREPQVVRCAECGAELEFERAGEGDESVACLS